MTETVLPVYIGYDPREHAAYMVCKSSLDRPLINKAGYTTPILLNTRQLRRDGDFDRPWRVDGKGQFHDERDGRPFSTEFSHSRFLVPHLAAKGRPAGKRGWALFVDCDFMFRVDAGLLLEHADPDKAIVVVKQPSQLVKDGVKMDGQVQQAYRRKLWSSLVLWNLDHPANVALVDHPELTNHMTGSELHSFSWLDDAQIGELPDEWNWIPGFTPTFCTAAPKAVHWSFGGPWMQGYENEPYSEEWRARLREIVERCLYFRDLGPLLPVL
jgi:hypothetical protein